MEKKRNDSKVVQAMKLVRKTLRKDRAGWESYKANIAMAFKDEMFRKGYKFPHLHEIANTAAENFMRVWTWPRKGEKP